LEISTLGRWAVWPTMFSIFLAMVAETWLSTALLLLGVGMTLIATVQYVAALRSADDYTQRSPSTST
nr:hypothetical protein [Thermoleophilaceae bacterium]